MLPWLAEFIVPLGRPLDVAHDKPDSLQSQFRIFFDGYPEVAGVLLVPFAPHMEASDDLAEPCAAAQGIRCLGGERRDLGKVVPEHGSVVALLSEPAGNQNGQRVAAVVDHRNGRFAIGRVDDAVDGLGDGCGELRIDFLDVELGNDAVRRERFERDQNAAIGEHFDMDDTPGGRASRRAKRECGSLALVGLVENRRASHIGIEAFDDASVAADGSSHGVVVRVGTNALRARLGLSI